MGKSNVSFDLAGISSFFPPAFALRGIVYEALDGSGKKVIKLNLVTGTIHVYH